MNEEVWKPIPAWPRYEASSHGRVRHVVTHRVRTLQWNAKFRGWQINLQRHLRDGQGTSTRHTYFVHQLVAAAFIGPCPPNHEVDHGDADRHNNRPENLSYVTHKGNMELAAQRGRMARGERSTHGKLTEAQVREIRRRYRKGVRGYGAPTLAKEFGVATQSIDAIVSGRHWGWL